MPEPHWEHGLRCHGYWADEHRRVGFVGLTPPGFPVTYTWSLDVPKLDAACGTATSLKVAKRRVERAWRLHQKELQDGK